MRTQIRQRAPLFAWVFGNFGHGHGHGNVTGLGKALESVQDQLPAWRGHSEQSMAPAALDWAKSNDRTPVISIATDAYFWIPGDADWDVGVPEVANH